LIPRFYFDVREGTSFTPDEEGLEFDSREVTVEVRNEHRQRVLTVKVSMEVDRVEPPPQPRAGETIVCEFPISRSMERK